MLIFRRTLKCVIPEAILIGNPASNRRNHGSPIKTFGDDKPCGRLTLIKIKNRYFQDFRCVVASLREAILNLLKRTPTSQKIGVAYSFI
jgi:hypothetical protein